MRKFSISILLLALITIGMVIPTVSATDNQVVITYGETCYLNNIIIKILLILISQIM